MIVAGYILSMYQFMLEERGQSVVGFTPVRRRGTSSQTQVSLSHVFARRCVLSLVTTVQDQPWSLCLHPTHPHELLLASETEFSGTCSCALEKSHCTCSTSQAS